MTEVNQQSGDEPDITGLLSSHKGWLRSVIVARLGGSSDADDVLQSVSVAAIEQKSPLREKSSATAWLYQLAVRQVMQFRRTAGRHRKRLVDAADVQRCTQTEPEDPLEWLLSTERRELVRKALRQISEECREVLMLKYVEGWSYRKIATQTGRTESAVESQLHRARQQLRTRLTQLNVNDGGEVS